MGHYNRHIPYGQDLGDLWLEIPRLNLQLPIVGVPLRDDGWDLTWLWDEAGWLEGTAYPSWAGNTVLTAHVYLPNGEPGPFVNLHTLYWGDTVILHANGQRYIYQVRSTRRVYPGDTSIINHEDEDWLTLLTCQGYNERKDAYDYRIVVRAVLLKVEPEP
jgi:LPXTG-site transpeptidase (sortase) family protein